MSIRYPVAVNRRRPPSARLAHVCRQQARRYAVLLDTVVTDPRFGGAFTVHPDLPLGAAVRSAAVQMGVAQLAWDRIQRVASRACLPLCPLTYYALAYGVDLRWQRSGTALDRAIAVVIVTTAMVAVFALVGMRSGIRPHLVLFVAPTLPAVAILATVHQPNTAAVLAVVVLLGPPTTYVAFIPALVLAFVIALRIRTTVDARGRIVLRLLRLLDNVMTHGDCLLTWRGRRDLMLHVERIARIAEHDLPRVLRGGLSDQGTAQWLAASCQVIAADFRGVKRVLVLPGGSPREDLVALLSAQFIRACSDDWEGFRSGSTLPPRRGRIQRILPFVVASVVLATAALTIPRLLHTGITVDAAGRFRAILLISAAATLVPLPSKPLLQVADALRDVTT